MKTTSLLSACLLFACSAALVLAQASAPFYVGAEGFTPPVSPVAYADGLYAVTDASGSVFFSEDAQTWDQIFWEDSGPLKSVRHDGERWIVATKDGKIAFSADRQVWTPFFESDAASENATLWRGLYWKSATTVLGVTYYDNRHGRYDSGRDEEVRVWDAQLLPPNHPALFWVQGGRPHVLREDGLNYVTDNGAYWQITRGPVVRNARKLFVAEGNGNVVSFVVPGKEATEPLVAFLQENGEFPNKVECPFKSVTGLAFGRGRFVVAASEASTGDTALYESTDGKAWTKISEHDHKLRDVVFGAAGFVASAKENQRIIYAPDPLPETPMPELRPVEVPAYAFTDVGSNFVGVGKKRKELPMTPAQKKVDDLSPRFKEAYDGDIAARVEMAHLEVEGKWIVSNPWRSEMYFQAGMEEGIPSAARGYAELLTRWKPETPRSEIESLYRQSAELGDSTAAVWLALNLPEAPAGDRSEIERWRDAALAADPAFAARYAKREQLDARLPRARAGELEAITTVVPILLEGDIRPIDWTTAGELAQQAAEQGNFAPATELVTRYQRKYAFSISDSNLADEAYRSIVDYGVESGRKDFVGLMIDHLINGRFGYTKDSARALAMATERAEAGEADFMFLTGAILWEVPGELQDKDAAKEWLRKAADAGQADAAKWLEQRQ